MRVVKFFEIVDNAVSKIFMKCDDPEVGRKLIGANRLQGSGQEEWHTQLLTHHQYKEHSFLYIVTGMQNAHKVQELTLSQAVISFDLEKQKIFKPGQKFERVVFDKNVLQESHKSYAEASQEYDRLLNTACLYFSDSSCTFL